MAPHRVRVDALAPQMTLGPREARHLHVLRLRVGDPLRVFDGQGSEAAATLTALDETRALLTLGEALAGAAETPQPVTLAVALLKGDKLADVVRAATELGAARIQLLVTRHADVRAVLADQRFSADTLRPGYPATSPGVLARRKESPSFIAMDDPDHAFFRRMLISEFSVKAVNRLRPMIE